MIPVSLSIAACFGWGIADFIGGLKSRELPTLSILFVSTATGILLLAGILIFTRIPVPGDPALFWAVPAGGVGLGAMLLLYRGLAVGTMSVLAPISATGVILPVLWGLFRGEALSGLKLLGIGIAVLGGILAAMENETSRKNPRLTRGIGYAVSAALFIGLYFILMDNAAARHPVWASMIMRSCTLAFLSPVLLMAKLPMGVGRPHLPVILVMGLTDTLAAFSFAAATSRGMISEVSVISSLYPAVTVLLSALIIRERLRRVQCLGVVLAIAGVVLISAF